MGGQYGSMKLGSSLQNGGDECDTKAPTLVTKQIGQTGSLVVLIFWKIRIRELARRHEQERNPKSLHHTRQRLAVVICGKIEAREVPHCEAKNREAQADESRHRNPLHQLHHQRSHDHNHHRTRTEHQPSVSGGITIERLQHLRNQHRRSEEHKAKEKIERIRQREVPFFEQSYFDYWIRMPQLPNHRRQKSRHGDDEEAHDEIALEPVLPLSPIEDYFKKCEADGNQRNPNIVDFELAAFACLLYLSPEGRWIGDNSAGQE